MAFFFYLLRASSWWFYELHFPLKPFGCGSSGFVSKLIKEESVVIHQYHHSTSPFIKVLYKHVYPANNSIQYYKSTHPAV